MAKKATKTKQAAATTPKKIDKLTPEQEAKIPEYVSKWIDIGFSTAPVDFENAKKAVCLAYTLAGLKEPTQFHVVDSPMSAIKFIQTLDPAKTPNDIFSEMIFGNHDASWLGFYQFFRDELNIEECTKLNGLIDLANYCGWLNVYEDVVVFQHRPKIIKMDDQKRLHCQDGPAIEYRDGFSVFAWHGVRIPGEWITDTKNSLTAQKALTWENVEQRRCACEILGWANILRTLDAKVINEDADPEVGTLVEVEIPEIGKERFLRVMCGTKREFALPVPPEMKTALEANAWTFGFGTDDFVIPEVRT